MGRRQRSTACRWKSSTLIPGLVEDRFIRRTGIESPPPFRNGSSARKSLIASTASCVQTARVRWLRNRTRLAKGSSGNPIRIDGVASDVTSRKQSEEDRASFERQIQQTQKLESLGVLAGGIAHDFNNLLTVVMGNVSLASCGLAGRQPDPGAPGRRPKGDERAADLAAKCSLTRARGRWLSARSNSRP